MHSILENPIYIKTTQLLSNYASIEGDVLAELSLNEIFNGNIFNCGIFLLNFSETFGLEKPLEVFNIDLKKTYLCDLIELIKI